MPRITDFCSCIYVFGCRLSLVRLCNSDFGITLVDDRDHLCCLLLPHSTYFICQFLVLLLFGDYCYYYYYLSPLDLYMAYAVILEFTVFTVYVNLVNVFSVGLTFETSDSHPAY